MYINHGIKEIIQAHFSYFAMLQAVCLTPF